MHTGQRNQVRVRVSNDAFAKGLRLKHFGEVLYHMIMDEFDAVVDKCQVTLITDEAADVLAGAALLMLESNHDEECLRSGPYPYSLKQRILGPLGHLSNDAAAAFAAQMARLGTREIVLAHLSRENNTPAMALERVGRALSGTGVRLSAAPRRELGGPYIVEVSNAKGQHPLCGETEGEVLPRCSGGIQ